MPTKVQRVDVGARIRADHRTVQGHARIPAALSRTGVQVYPQADGTVRREYRPPNEVFASDSLKTFDTATVTVGHPDMVTPANWKQHAVGDIRNAKADRKFVAAELVIRDADTLAKIDSGELAEISCGYDCMLEMTPGTSPDGEKYDAIQHNIVINHVGLGPKDWGRAGNDVRLRLDGGGVAYLNAEEAGHRPPAMDPKEIEALKAKVDAAEAEAKAAKARADAAEAKLAGRSDAELAKAEAARDTAEAELAKLKAAPVVKTDELVTQRIAILDGARLLTGKPVENKGTDREIMIAAVNARHPAFKADGKSDEYVRARFDATVETVSAATDSLMDLNRGTAPTGLNPGARNDGADAELAQLAKHFDAAPDLLENYHRAEPWLHGETSAMNAARKSVGG